MLDYVINVGGIINVYYEIVLEGYSVEVLIKYVEGIYDILIEIFVCLEKE